MIKSFLNQKQERFESAKTTTNLSTNWLFDTSASDTNPEGVSLSQKKLQGLKGQLGPFFIIINLCKTTKSVSLLKKR